MIFPARPALSSGMPKQFDKVYGEVATTGVNELALIVREPLGAIAAVLPWNFPLLLALDWPLYFNTLFIA